MNEPLIVYKKRTNVVSVSLGINVQGDTITSEIRTLSGTLIATWTVSFVTNGSDGELLLTLDNSVTTSITQTSGLMDLKRVTGGEPVSIFEKAVEVEFRDVVTQ